MTEQIIQMPGGTDAQEAGWHALMDLSVDVPEGWTVVGGQMVHLWCAERGSSVVRPTDDADTVLDVRSHPQIHLAVTTSLKSRGFKPITSPDGIQHRWRNGDAVVDVLIPRHLGAAAQRRGAGGGPAIETPGHRRSSIVRSGCTSPSQDAPERSHGPPSSAPSSASLPRTRSSSTGTATDTWATSSHSPHSCAPRT